MADIRFWIGRIRRFGIKKALYERNLSKWNALLPYNAFDLTDEQTTALIRAAEETGITVTDESVYQGASTPHGDKEHIFVLHMPTDTSCAAAIKTYVAIEAARYWNETGRMPGVIYADEKGIYKPDWSPETLLSRNYIGQTLAVRADIYDECGFCDDKPHESVLRLTAAAEGDVCHVRRALSIREANQGAADEDATTAIRDELKRHGVEANAIKRTIEESDGAIPCYNWEPEICNRNSSDGAGFRDDKSIDEVPIVSVIIPTRDHADILRTCIDSVFKTAGDISYEIIIAENCSVEAETYDYYDEIDELVRIEPCDCEFNFSYICNYGAAFARGRYLLFLNNDIEAYEDGWMERMAAYLSMPDISAVGAKLFYPDGTIQHGGVTVGIRGVAGHSFIGYPHDARGYEDRLVCVYDLSAVTAACMMVKAEDFWAVGGFDEKLAVAFNDTDLCMRLREAGGRILFLPNICLIHHESKSRGRDENDKNKLKRFNRESMRFQRDWFYRLIEGDPYYNPNLSYEDDDFREVCRVK